MTPFALPYDPDVAPVLTLIGIGYRPAWQPADYIGPRLDCPMWVSAPDADQAYLTKYDLPEIDPYAVADSLSGGQHRIMPALSVPHETLLIAHHHSPWGGISTGGGASGAWRPCCTVTDPGLPPVAPVSISADAGGLLAFAIVTFAIWKWMKS